MVENMINDFPEYKEMGKIIKNKDNDKISRVYKKTSEVIDLLLPWNNISTFQKTMYFSDILNKVFKALFPDMEENNKKSTKSEGKGFFPATIEFFSERYGILPSDLMKKVTMGQLRTYSAGMEWNTNIQNGKSNLNQRILNREISKSEEFEAKERLRQLFNKK